MAIPTTRSKEAGQIVIDKSKCSGCGQCVEVCKDLSLEIIDKKVALSDKSLFGCIACGHCMMICKNDAIIINGREMGEDSLTEQLDSKNACDYNALLTLLSRRRSIREFKDIAVENEKIEKILAAAQTAPMGLPPSDVHVLVLENKQAVQNFSKDYCTFLESMKWLVSDFALAVMRPFWGKTNDEMFRKFIKPLMDVYVENGKKGEDWVTYNAPLAMYFYGSPYSDPADPIVAATYAMLAGESLGLGTCMLGAVHPFIQNGKKARLFREKYGIKHCSQEGLIVIFGYSKVHYSKGVKRTFADIHRLS